MDYIAQPKDYWIATQAINIALNALNSPNRIQGSVASGAVILCYIEGVDGLGYDNGHRFKTWPLTVSPTYFNSNTEKYVYVAIPRTSSVGTQAIVVFPSEKLDIYGVNANDEHVGSTDYYYIWLQSIITATDGTTLREWQQTIDFGKKGTDEDLYDDTTSDWYLYSKVNEVVTFLKNIAMKAGTTFHNLILGNKELTGVATSGIAYTDSDTLVVTPGYVESQYLSKTHESEAQEQIGFLKGLWIGVRSLYEITTNGIAKLKSVIAEDVNTQRVQTGELKSPNYTGDDVADTGFRLTNSHNGHSKLTIDEIYVRMKAVFESLEVRERTYTGGDQIWSCAGNRIIRVDYLGNVETADHVPQMMNVHADGRPEGQGKGDVYSVPVPGDTYGYSDVKVPWLLRQMPLLARAKVFARYRKVRIVINEPAGNSTNRAAASESPLANIRRARCYFIAKDDGMEVHNWWRINDLARCQTMNLANTTRQTYISGEDEKAGNIFWWRKVIGVSYEPVTLDDGKQYHYFDVAFDYEYEQSHPEVMATSVMEGSDIPAAQDAVVQFGNTIIEGRMNLMMMEVNGGDAVGYNPTTDAPCLKAYRGVYCFDPNKSWVGGNPCKMNLSPSKEFRFTGSSFKIETEYDVVPVPVDRGLWADIVPTRDDYREHTMVRKCYYYDKVSHNGSYWLCSIVNGAHWVDSNGNYISDDDYAALSDAAKAQCSRKQNYTIEEPSANSIDWTEVVRKGDAAPYYVEDYGIGASRTDHSDITNWSSTQPSPTEQKPYVWKRSRLYNPNTQTYSDTIYVCLTGEKGDDGADGADGDNGADGADAVDVSLSPEEVLVTQSTTSPYNIDLSNAETVVSVNEGGVPKSFAISNVVGTHCNASVKSGTTDTIEITSIGTYNATVDGETVSRYYDNGYVTFDVTYGGNTYPKRFNFYANLLGTWKETVIGDTKTEVAESIEYAINGTTGQIDGYEALGEFKRSSTENISKITRGLQGSNINLLYGVDGYTASNKLVHKSSAIDGYKEYDGNGAQHIFTSVQLIEGCTYTIQCMTDGTIASSHDETTSRNPSDKLCTVWLRMNNLLNGGYIGECFTSSYEGYKNLGGDRHKWTFVCKKTGEYWFRTNSYSDGTTEVTINFWNIKLEGGDTETVWSGSTSQMTSEIRQTAEAINLGITQGLQRTGIDITNGIINLIANKTLFKTSDGVPMIAVQMADANGNVGTGPTYTIPSIVFYDGEINNGGQVRWVLNYRGLIEALSNTHDYKMTPVEGYLSFFNLGNNDNPNRAGMNIEETFTPAMLAKEDYPRSVRVGGNNYYHEVFYLFTSGYQIINGNLIYIPSNGPDYENIYWQTQGLTDDKRPDYNLEEHITGTNAPANGYYVKIVERKRTGNEDDTSGGQISFAQYSVTYEIYELVNGAVNETGIRFYLSYNGRKIESPLHYYETYGAEITVNDVLYYENDELKLKNILGIE